MRPLRPSLALLCACLLSGGFYVGPPVVLTLVGYLEGWSEDGGAEGAYVEQGDEEGDGVEVVLDYEVGEEAAAPEAAPPPPPPPVAAPPPPPPANMDVVADPLSEKPPEELVAAPVEPPPVVEKVEEKPPVVPVVESEFLDMEADGEEELAEAPDATPDAARKGPLGIRKKPTAGKGPKAGGAGGKKGKKCLPADPRITQLGMYEYRIDGAMVEYYSGHLGEAMKLAWTDWHKDERGDVDGFSVRHMRCGSPLHQAGLRNNDVIHEINGRKIESIPDALLAFRKLKKKDVIKVELTRHGETVRMRYEIDDGQPEETRKGLFRRRKGEEEAPPAAPAP